VTLQVLFDGSNQLRYASEASPTEAFVGDLAKPPFDQVQPGTRSWDKVEMEPRVASEPGFHARMLVSPIVVHDQMQIDFGGGLGIYLVEKSNELLMPMARHAVADDFAVEHTESREQGGCAVAFVIVRHRAAATLFEWKARLSSVESLDLAFLVDREHQGLVRRIQIQTDNVDELLDKTLVAAEFEGSDQVRFEVVPFPYSTDRSLAQRLSFGHTPCTPMRRVGRARLNSRLDYRTHFALRNLWDTSATRSIFFQSWQSQSQKSLPPQLDCRARDFQSASNLLAQNPLGCHSDDLGTLNQARREAFSMCPPLQDRALYWRQYNGLCGSHCGKA